jgi:zinc transport system substrate-binding protein
MNRFVPWILAVVTLVGVVSVAAGCGGSTDSGSRVGVVVTIPPQAEFVERVGGDEVDVMIMVPLGEQPHAYDPKPSQLEALSRARMYAKVGSGIDFELAQMDDLIAINPEMLLVNCSDGVDLIPMAGEQAEDHDHGAMDPHIWMSPVNAMIMVGNICDGLAALDPENREYYEGNRDAYLEDLAQLDQDINDALSGVTNRKFIVYHPSFGYFAHEYDLTMLAIEDEGNEPSGAWIAHVIEEAREAGIKVVFASPQFNQKSAEVIADGIDGTVVLVDPLAEDYVDNVYDLLDKLVEAME